MPPTIRRATAADAPAIGELAAEFQSYLRARGSQGEFRWGADEYLRDGFGEDPAFQGLVAEEGGPPVGFALYASGYDTTRGERYVYLIDLFVTASHRRRGVGQALMRAVGEIGRRRGAEAVAWSVLTGDRAARSFYEKLGAAYVDDSRVMWWDTSPRRPDPPCDPAPRRGI